MLKDVLFRTFLKVTVWLTLVILFPARSIALDGGNAASPTGGEAAKKPQGVADVFVIPIHGPITPTQLYILRRAVKEAIELENAVILVDVDTPGGEVQTTLEIMEVLDRFEGETISFIRKEAVSAGSYIVSSTKDIYMAPASVVGAADVVMGTGNDVPETMKRKIRSLLRAKVRAYNKDHPHRAKVVRAMMEDEFVLEMDGEILKGEGELLTLTADEAVKQYGNPPSSLFATGIYPEVEKVLGAHFGNGGYHIRNFEITWSENLAHQLNLIAPILLGLAVLGLFIEFKTPGFGVFGILGLVFFAIFFASHFVAGLSGHEEVIVFLVGVGLILLEVFVLPGTIIPAMVGAILILGSLVYALADYWPGQMGGTPFEGQGKQIFDFTIDTFLKPMVQVLQGFLIAGLGALLAVQFLPKMSIWNQLILDKVSGRLDPVVSAGGQSSNQDSELPDPGTPGMAITDLFPSGEIEIGGKRYQARVVLGSIRRGRDIKVSGKQDFTLLVEEVERMEA